METSPSKRPSRIRRMFGSIADRYDLLNRLLSFGIDRRWRRVLAGEVRGEDVLDVACGTGDVVRSLRHGGYEGRLTGLDFSRPMLRRAAGKLREKGRGLPCALVQGDALALPFPEATFSSVTVAFGVRNFSDRPRGFRETLRVLQPGGVYLILEFFPPPNRWYLRPFRFYLRHVLPRIGRLVSGSRRAYGYLRDSIEGFCRRDRLRDELVAAGFSPPSYRELNGGIATLIRARKPPGNREEDPP